MNPAWAPERFRYATGKLIAYFVAQRPKERRFPEVLHWQKDQNAVGTIGSSIVYFTAWTLLWIELLVAAAEQMHPVGIVLLALLATSNFSLLTVLCFPIADRLAGSRRREPTRGNDITSRLLNLLFIVASALVIWADRPGRSAATFWLTIVGINAVASFLVNIPLRKKIERLNQELRSIPSGL